MTYILGRKITPPPPKTYLITMNLAVSRLEVLRYEW